MFQKELISGPAGSVSISEEAGELKLSVSGSLSLGGGQAAGAVKGKASLELDLEAKQLIDAGLELAKAKFPAASALIEAAKAAIDAELAKA